MSKTGKTYRPRREYTPADDALILCLYAEGRTWPEIAAALGRPGEDKNVGDHGRRALGLRRRERQPRDDFVIPPTREARRPTRAIPGSRAKVRVLAARYASGQLLHHPRDARRSVA